ncbi:tetratricopeptide repeat protein [Caulobacter sp. UNC279MFTsu5.1]|uniref:tetratricopeptide repeat protein n=1 Tax=Caulobacter sp. UNC279MFTsu5.1 TaxID=1502775 RepID=UPI0003742B88|nr:tetratricopeptide repeat protein [Caulobacter sp. UNC279MFTsu5.1]SFI92614.1 Tetratricopeptide repeat-containing protein [Caulobacter sp. UNC279MFTsu5.1]
MRALAFMIVVLACLAGSPSLARDGWARANPLYQPTGPRQERALDRARALVARRDYPAAIAAFDEVIALQPQFARAIAERAFAREAAGDLAGATSDHDAVLRLTPDSANAWSHAGWIRALRGVELDQALACSDKAVGLEPTIDPLDTRGFVHFRRGEFELALADYDAALRLAPRSATTLYIRGLVKRRLGDPTAGAADIERALKLDPRIGEVWKRRGVEA